MTLELKVTMFGVTRQQLDKLLESKNVNLASLVSDYNFEYTHYQISSFDSFSPKETAYVDLAQSLHQNISIKDQDSIENWQVYKDNMIE